MKLIRLLLFTAFMLLLSSVSVCASIFEEPKDQIYWENLNNLDRLCHSAFGGVHEKDRNYSEDLKFLEMTVRELQKKHKDDKELQALLNEVKKTLQPAVRAYKKKEQNIIHGPCQRDSCAFLGHFMPKHRHSRSWEEYPIDEVIRQLEPRMQKADFRNRRKLEIEETNQLRLYAGKLSAFSNACQDLEKHIRQLIPK